MPADVESLGPTSAKSPWRSTLVLTLTAIWAGGGLVTPGCYLDGRRWAEARGLKLFAYSPDAAWVHVVAASVAAIWLVFFVVRLRPVPTFKLGIIHVLLPLASLAYWTWWASGNAMPCAN
jgi:hypothetical protein